MRTVDKIQEVLGSKNIKASKMMKDLGFSSGLFSQWKSGKQEVSLEKIIKIADYLDCSVDYLLGRTNTPEENIINNNSTINGGVQAIKSPVTVNAKENTDSNDIMNQFMQAFSELPFENKVAALNFVLDMKRSA